MRFRRRNRPSLSLGWRPGSVRGGPWGDAVGAFHRPQSGTHGVRALPRSWPESRGGRSAPGGFRRGAPAGACAFRRGGQVGRGPLVNTYDKWPFGFSTPWAAYRLGGRYTTGSVVDPEEGRRLRSRHLVGRELSAWPAGPGERHALSVKQLAARGRVSPGPGRAGLRADRRGDRDSEAGLVHVRGFHLRRARQVAGDRGMLPGDLGRLGDLAQAVDAPGRAIRLRVHGRGARGRQPALERDPVLARAGREGRRRTGGLPRRVVLPAAAGSRNLVA